MAPAADGPARARGARSALPALNFFSGGNNRLSGSLPPEYAQLTALVSFMVNHNELSGTIPLFPPSLQVADLRFNQISGTLPTWAADSSALTTLQLGEPAALARAGPTSGRPCRA